MHLKHRIIRVEQHAITQLPRRSPDPGDRLIRANMPEAHKRALAFQKAGFAYLFLHVRSNPRRRLLFGSRRPMG
jgi:hypothetical protein